MVDYRVIGIKIWIIYIMERIKGKIEITSQRTRKREKVKRRSQFRLTIRRRREVKKWNTSFNVQRIWFRNARAIRYEIDLWLMFRVNYLKKNRVF